MVSPIAFVENLRDRDVSFTLFRTALHQNDLNAGQGWEKTIEKLAEYLDNEKHEEKYTEAIYQIYTDLNFYGTKLVKIYIHEELEEVKKLLDENSLISDTKYTKSYPLLLSPDILDSEPMGPSLVYKKITDRSTTLVFCSRQTITEREKIDAGYASDAMTRDYGEFDELVGIKRKSVQLFDLVILDLERGCVEFRMDGLEKQRVDDIKARLKRLTHTVNDIIDTQTGSRLHLVRSTNFFPVIEKLYKQEDGRIKEIGHATTTAGVHNGRARGRKNDVRKDAYHENGAKALDEIKAFTLTKGWDSPTGHGVVSLVIPGTLGMSNDISPAIDIACLTDCACADDYELLLQKLLQ